MVTQICEQCGCEYSIYPSEVGKQRFCGKQCQADGASRPVAERFWEKVDRRGPDDCWLWTAGRSCKGIYGQFYMREVPHYRLAHRVAVELHTGSPIPAGMEVDHLCRVPLCVNPRHLSVVPPRTNARRRDLANHEKSAATHCKHGHAFSPENTNIATNGTRHCRECHRRWGRERYHRLREQRALASTP